MNNIFTNISISAKEISQDACVIGRYVLSSLLNRKIYQSVDILTEGSGILLAQKVSNKFYHHSILTTFRRFGTARFKNNGNKIEFIDKNNIIIYQKYTITISLNPINYGLIIDTLNLFVIDIFSIIRSIRFASELQFIEQISFYFFFEQKNRLISLIMVSIEVIINDFNKIILSQKPSNGLSLLYETGLLFSLLPEITCLKEFEEKEGSNHKDNFYHTLEVVENVSEETCSLWLRWAAFLHDIGKYITKKYIHGSGWTFHAHECIGSMMIPYFFHRLKIPMENTVKYVQKIIKYSSRPISLGSYEATDSSIRRLLFYVGEDIEDLFFIAKADITTKKIEKKNRYLNSFFLTKKKLKNIDLKDSCIKFNTIISGNEIMQFFQLQPSPQIGIIKKAIKETILDGKLVNNFPSVYSCMLKINSII
jgi:tRNA nucleotidyltransferase/poly(A) polymerase